MAQVRVLGPNGKETETYAIIDGCSQATIVREDTSDAAGLKGVPVEFSLGTLFDPSRRIERKQVSFAVTTASFEGETIPISNAYVVSKENFKLRYTQHLPAGFREQKCFQHLTGLGLKDINADDITILIGADVPDAILTIEVREGPANTPRAVRTKLGWILIGVAEGGSVTKREEISKF